MKTKNEFHTIIDLKGAKYNSPNTIEIPESYRNFLLIKISKYGSLSYYINQLISKYSYLIIDGYIIPSQKIKVLYQDKGLNLFPKKFRSYNDSDWSVLKILANCLNVSKCKLIVMLIEFDMAEIKIGIITTNQKIQIGHIEQYYPIKQLIVRTKFNFKSIRDS